MPMPTYDFGIFIEANQNETMDECVENVAGAVFFVFRPHFYRLNKKNYILAILGTSRIEINRIQAGYNEGDIKEYARRTGRVVLWGTANESHQIVHISIRERIQHVPIQELCE